MFAIFVNMLSLMIISGVLGMHSFSGTVLLEFEMASRELGNDS